jgi:hypothetical protein
MNNSFNNATKNMELSIALFNENSETFGSGGWWSVGLVVRIMSRFQPIITIFLGHSVKKV